MIPSTEAHVPSLLVPVTKDFFKYGSIATKLGYPVENLFQWHGIKHILRVLVLTLIYCQHSGDTLSEEDRLILIYFSLLHDIGRDSEIEDETHGDKSVELIRRKNIRIKGIQLTKKGYPRDSIFLLLLVTTLPTGLLPLMRVLSSTFTSLQKQRELWRA